MSETSGGAPAGGGSAAPRPQRRRKGSSAAIVRWAGWAAVKLRLIWIPVWLARALGPMNTARFASHLARRWGPFFKEHKIARANIEAAFPEKSEAEVKAILSGMWDNLGRLVAEAFHIEWVTAFDETTGQRKRITGTGREIILALKEQKKSAIIFSAHLANWEVVPTIGATGLGVQSTILYRSASSERANEVLAPIRGGGTHKLISSKRGATWNLAEAFEKGGTIGLMMDQRAGEGIAVPFFGRPAMTNPILARLARVFDVPVHGVRVIRLPDSRFHVEVTPAIELPRDKRGRVDVEKATAKINEIIEGWVREHPEQWLWVHDRWKMPQRRPSEAAAGSNPVKPESAG
ncbi:MAG: lipid A biosynthesis lauroyl acyltransferase [Bauldia sp.]|nr:lipid A biosynthesis lauroyl acyltransferase [Bauldia sp.]